MVSFEGFAVPFVYADAATVYYHGSNRTSTLTASLTAERVG